MHPFCIALIAVTACFSTTATANLNHACIMNEAENVISRTSAIGNLSEKRINAFWRKVEKLGTEAGCWIWTAAQDRDGYGVFGGGNQHVAIKQQQFRAHRLSWEITHGEIPISESGKPLCVLHRCDTPSCVNPEHLWLGTPKQNRIDCFTKGRAKIASGERHMWHGSGHLQQGSKNRMAKLNEVQVSEIKTLLKQGLTHAKVGQIYGVSRRSVGSIANNQAWRHVA
jgi:hypothetical protein